MHLCNETITVYNTYTDPTTHFQHYLPTVIVGASWFSREVDSITNDGMRSSNQAHIRIPDYANTSNKPFVKPKAYAAMSVADKALHWTLNGGDIIVKGIATETGSDAKPDKLSAKYERVATITAVTDNRRVVNAPHWRITASEYNQYR